MSSEFVTIVPDIFNEYELEDLVYLETRRARGSNNPLSGNLDASIATLNESTYARAMHREPFKSWQQQETIAVKQRLHTLKKLSGLAVIASSSHLDLTQHQNEGQLHLYADEAPVVIFSPGGETLLHLKVNYGAIADELVVKALHRYASAGHDVSSAGVYVGPHAHTLPLTASEFAEMNAKVRNGSTEVKQMYQMFTKIDPAGHPILDFSSMLFHQLEGAGIRPGDIEMSNEDTRAPNSPYFSQHRGWAHGTVEGRFGILIGKRPRR